MRERLTMCVAGLFMFVSACVSGVPVVADEQGRDVVSPAQPSARVREVTMLDAVAFEARVRTGEAFVTIITHPGCGITPKLLDALAKDQEADWANVTVLDLGRGVYAPHFLSHHLPYLKGVPVLVAIDQGQVVDMRVGVSSLEVVRGFVARHLRDVPEPQQTATTLQVPDMASYVRDVSSSAPLNLEGVSFQYMTLSHRSLSGSNLRGASFNHAKLNFITFSRADLTGATFEGATLEHIFWGDCICPDGTNSREHGLSCDGHGVQLAPFALPPRPTGERNPDGSVTESFFLANTHRMLMRQYKRSYESPQPLASERAIALVAAQLERMSEPHRARTEAIFARAREGAWRFYVLHDPRGLAPLLLFAPGESGDIIPERAGLILLSPLS